MTVVGAILLLVTGVGCNRETAPGSADVLVRFGSKELIRAEVAQFIPKGLSNEDSLLFAKQYIDHWIEEQAIADAARTQVEAAEVKIKPKLEAYERDLLAQLYTDWLVEKNPERFEVTDADILAYYSQFPDKFVAESPFYSFFHVVTLESDPWKIKNLMRSRETKDIDELASWCTENAFTFKLDSSYVTEMELISAGAGFSYGDIKKAGKEVVYTYTHSQNDTTYNHYFKLLGVLKPGETMPLSICKPKISSIILNQRRLAIIEEYREQLVQDARNGKKFRVINP